MSLPILIKPPLPHDDGDEPSVGSFQSRLLDSLYDGVYFVDTERRITYWNKGAEHLTGYKSAEVIGMHCFDNLLMHVDGTGHALCVGDCPLSQTICDGGRRQAEVYLRHKKGHRIPVDVRTSPIEDESGEIIGAVEVFSDISAMKKLERQAGELKDLAYGDALTGVANRRYIELKVKQAIEEVECFGREYGLILIDIDQFKLINDTHGHEAGDVALRATCETLTRCVRHGDIVGRWGGDEFLILATNVTASLLEGLAQRCVHLVEETIVPVGSNLLRISVSLGATILRGDDACEMAVGRADRLMYVSKKSGRNRFTLD